MGYYKTIKGKRMDARIIELAEAAIKNSRNEQISMETAKSIVKATKDAGRITEVEKTTLLYILRKFNWTAAASSWLKNQIGKLKPSYYKTIGGKKMDGAILEAAAKAVKGAGDGRISKADAFKIFKASKDGGIITNAEIETLAHVYHKYKWTDAAAAWFAGQLEQNKDLAS